MYSQYLTTDPKVGDAVHMNRVFHVQLKLLHIMHSVRQAQNLCIITYMRHEVQVSISRKECSDLLGIKEPINHSLFCASLLILCMQPWNWHTASTKFSTFVKILALFYFIPISIYFILFIPNFIYSSAR